MPRSTAPHWRVGSSGDPTLPGGYPIGMWLIVLALTGCGRHTDQNATPSDTGREIWMGSWEGGDFRFHTLKAEDGCLDGALEALFMPEGAGQPHDFEYPIYVPAYEECPTSYEIDLREPFVGMPVTVDCEPSEGFRVRGSVMDAVELGAGTYGDCVVTMTVDADIWPTSADTIAGTAWIDISDPRGNDGRCPVFTQDPCTVTLTLSGDRE